MPGTRANVKNEKQYEALKDKGMSKQRAAKIANSPDASSNGGKKSGSGGNAKQGGHHRAAQGRRAQGRPSSGKEEVASLDIQGSKERCLTVLRSCCEPAGSLTCHLNPERRPQTEGTQVGQAGSVPQVPQLRDDGAPFGTWSVDRPGAQGHAVPLLAPPSDVARWPSMPSATLDSNRRRSPFFFIFHSVCAASNKGSEKRSEGGGVHKVLPMTPDMLGHDSSVFVNGGVETWNASIGVAVDQDAQLLWAAAREGTFQRTTLGLR